MNKTLSALFALTLLAGAVATPALASPPDRTTIVDAAAGNPDFSTLVAAVVKADLVGILDGNRQFTVFAPTNAAFDAAAEALLGAGQSGIDLVDALPEDQLREVLLYHVSPGRRTSESVVAAEKIRMMNKQFTTPSVADGAAYIDGALIQVVDIEVDNGIIHVIGGVILPE